MSKKKDKQHRAVRRALVAATFSSITLVPALSSAAPSSVAVAQGVGKQPTLAVGFDERGTLRARVCAAAPCGIEDGRAIDVDPGAVKGIPAAKLSIVPIGADRKVIVVSVPENPAHADVPNAVAFQTIIAARPGSTEPVVLFSGLTGLVEGQPGERRGPIVVISEPEADGTRYVLVGEQREDINLCGRPTILAPDLVNPPDLKLKPAKVQRLSRAERDNARSVVAERLREAVPPGIAALRVIAASSALGDPAAVTDGDLRTAWSEARGGAGKGEFLLMQAAAELPIAALELVFRPLGAVDPLGVAPSELWVVTRDAVVRVTIPEDGFREPGARYHVKLDPPLASDCLALVIGDAGKVSPDAHVTVTELVARTEFDALEPAALVELLSAGGARADAAVAALRAHGAAGVSAVDAKYDTLGEQARLLALDAVDHAACRDALPVYVRALAGPYEAHRSHVRDRMRRCGPEIGAALAEEIGKAKPEARAVLANELAMIDPARAVSVILPLLDAESAAIRGPLRVVLARAASSEHAAPLLRSALDDERLAQRVSLEVLRSLGPRLATFAPEAIRAFERLARVDDFRTRFLLLEPAAELAKASPSAKNTLARALSTDPSPYVRARAADLLVEPSAYRDELLRALRDPSVRVREAAAKALHNDDNGFAVGELTRRLREDPWPLVRAVAAEALAYAPADDRVDAALMAGLKDEAPHAVVAVLLALGERRVLAAAREIEKRLEDREQVTSVRVAAAQALGLMCDGSAVELLTRYARKAADPLLPEDLRAIALASLEALGRLYPPDLQERLAPLLDKKAPRDVQTAAHRVLRSKARCGPRKPPRRTSTAALD